MQSEKAITGNKMLQVYGHFINGYDLVLSRCIRFYMALRTLVRIFLSHYKLVCKIFKVVRLARIFSLTGGSFRLL